MRAGFLALAFLSIGLVSSASAQPGYYTPAPQDGFLVGGPGTGQPLGFARGSGVFHGNYCGVGDNGPGLPPVDALDRACMHHDSCTPEGGLPTCGCNARFSREVSAVRNNPRQPDDLRALAGLVAAAIPVIPCDH